MPTPDGTLPGTGQWQYDPNTGGVVRPEGGGPGWVNDQHFAEAMMNTVDYPTDIPNAAAWTQMMQQGANAPEGRNPYMSNVANQGYAAQDVAQQRLMAALGGPSVTNLQARIGQDQNLQAAVRAGAGGRSGPGVMQQAAQNAGAMAAQQGQGALREYMGAQQAAGQGAQAQRGQALQVMQDQTRAGLQARELSDQNRQFYAQQGARLALAQRQAAIERYKLFQNLQLRRKQQQQQGLQMGVGAVAGALGGA